MRRWMVRISCFIAVLVFASWAAAQTEFSAEMVDTSAHRADKGPTKIYFAKDKVRFDSPEKQDPRGGGSMIWDLSKSSWVVLMPQQHMYMEMPAQMAEKRGVYHFFRTGDVENACSDWLKLPQNQGGSCHKVGSETVNGRSTVKYEGTNSKGESGSVWLDPKLRFPVKWEGKDGHGGELQNIQEGSQPASLFEIPAGYQKFDMGGMMQKMGQQPQ